MMTRAKQISENLTKNFKQYDMDTPKGLNQMRVATLIDINISLGILVDMYAVSHCMYPSEYEDKYKKTAAENIQLRRHIEKMQEQIAVLQGGALKRKDDSDG